MSEFDGVKDTEAEQGEQTQGAANHMDFSNGAKKVKACKYCRVVIDKKAKICPNCGKKQKKALPKVILGFVIAFVILLIFASAVQDARTKQAAQEVGETFAAVDTFDRYEVTKESGGYRITVYVDGAYYPDAYMTYVLMGTDNADVIGVSDIYNWDFYVDGAETTYTGFYTAIYTNAVKDAYDQALDVYSDALEAYSDTLNSIMGSVTE